jgi:hypothetical protein
LGAAFGWLNQSKNWASATGVQAMHAQATHSAPNASLRKRHLSDRMALSSANFC